MLSCTPPRRRRHRTVPPAGRVVDLGRMLELLAAAARSRTPHGLVGEALSMAGHMAEADLALLREHGVRDLAVAGRLPVDLTLGATFVLDAAQRSQDRGDTRSDALERATEAAIRFLDLVPERALAVGAAPAPALAGRMRRGRH